MAAHRSSPATRTAMTRRASCEPGQPGLDVASGGALAAAGQDAVDRQRPERAEQVGTSSASRAARSGVSRCSSASVRAIGSASSRSRSASPSLVPSSSASSVGSSARAAARRSASGRVALVEELRDVAEQQRLGERRGRAWSRPRRRVTAARVDVAHQLDQPGHVEDVLHALAHRLEHDREDRVLAGHLEQLRGPLALLPQRLAAVGPTPGQQQGPRRALAEPCREQRRTADLAR